MTTDVIRRERLLISAAVLTSFFGEFVKFVLAIWVYTVTESVVAFAALAIVGFLPNIVLAPKIGVWLDRTNKINALRRAAATLAAAALAGALGIAFGLPPFALALLVTLPVAIADAIEAPAYGVAAAQLVAKRRLQSFNGITESARSFSIMIAPILGGVLIAAIAPVQVMLGAAAIAAAAWLILLQIPPVESGRKAASPSSKSSGETLQELRNTLALIFSRPSLTGLLISSAILNGLMAAYIVLFYPMVLQQFAEQDVGLIRASFALGMVAGGLVAQLPILRRGGVRLVMMGAAFTTILLMAIALGPRLSGVLVLQAAIGATLTCMQAKGQTLWQELTPEAVLGRVFATRRMIAFAVVPLMYATTPLLVQLSIEALARVAPLAAVMQGAAAGERLTLATCSLCCLGALLWLVRSTGAPLPSRASDDAP
ncbi:MAG TPA: MFS transporter [Allosphingosinicella sp.]|nr:MFS transporter [Allosphingosinicella sp.]